MISGSAGRQINRVGAKYRSESIYIIYDKPCMYIQHEVCRQVGGSAGRHIDISGAKCRSTSIDYI